MRRVRVGKSMSVFNNRRQRGVTLIEMIVAIVVSGILIAMVGMFVNNQVTAYFDVARRAELSDVADGVLRRIARDVQGSLPNSLRPATIGSSFIEFVPIVNAGRFASQDTSVLSSPLALQGPPISVAAGLELVICNTGQSLADVYSGNNRRALPAAATSSSLGFSGSAVTDYCSSNRYQIIGGSVVYAFEAPRTLWRYSGCAINSAQSTTIAALDTNCNVKSMIASTAESINFNYSPNVMPSLGILTVRLILASADATTERVTLLHQINVVNSP